MKFCASFESLFRSLGQKCF